MNILPLTVLVHEGPMARAYLSLLRHAGFMPRKVILMVLAKDPSGKPVARWMPHGLRVSVAGQAQDLRYNHPVREVTLKHAAAVEAILASVSSLDVPRDYVADLVSRAPYGTDVVRVLVAGYGDPALAEAVGADAGLVLFTGGGIVPKSLLSLPNTTFLHVHPGALPDVRGADGLLWSLLLRGRPACSCFAMAPGIDTGRLLAVQEFDAPRVALTTRPDDAALYTITYSILDPLLRAVAFREVVRQTDSLQSLAFRDQDLAEGATYHFMHAALRKEALRLLYPPG